jgi:hypothetical protein
MCPTTGGAFKRVGDKIADSRWAHVACAVWVHETFLDGQGTAVGPIRGVDKIDKVPPPHTHTLS